MSSPGCCRPLNGLSGPIGIDFYPTGLPSAKFATAPTAPHKSLVSNGIPCYRKDMSATSGLDGLLEPLSRCLDADSARRVVELQVATSIQERIATLAERANEGTLSDDERLEYEALVNATDFIAILQLKARQHLDSQIQ
jgi:hypothetical protein